MNRVYLVATFCFLFVSGAAADIPATATVTVNCSAGDRIKVALLRPAVELTIEITGICEEDVKILRSRVTLRGTNPATDGIRPAPDGFKQTALDIFGVSRFNIENLSLAGANIGLAVNASFGVRVDNCLIEDNGFAGVIAGTGSDVDVVDTVIRNIGGDPNRGIWVANGSAMLCIRCTIENHRTGILLRQGSEMVLNDSTVRGTRRGVDARGGSRFVSFLFNGTGPSTIEGVSQDAIRLLDNSSASLNSGNINGRIRLFGSSVADLAGTSQSNPSLFVNEVRSSSSLVARNSASLVGDFEITEFSNVTLPAGSTVSGSLFCSLGADAVCDTPLTATSFSDCGQCLNP